MTVDGVLSNVSAVLSTVVNIISGNSVLSAYVGIGLVAMGALVFKALIAR